MGFSRRRPGREGRPRYTAYYGDIRGRERSAGTFARKKDAAKAPRASPDRAAASLTSAYSRSDSEN